MGIAHVHRINNNALNYLLMVDEYSIGICLFTLQISLTIAEAHRCQRFQLR